MEDEEKIKIAGCRILSVGSDAFLHHLRAELAAVGFEKAAIAVREADIVIVFNGNPVGAPVGGNIPVIVTFDFILGAGSIVMHGEELPPVEDLRLWAAEYMLGYCAFWRIDGCEWLQESLAGIRAGRTDDCAVKSAAHMAARIAANIAVGRPVKHFPRFYLHPIVRSGLK